MLELGSLFSDQAHLIFTVGRYILPVSDARWKTISVNFIVELP